MRSFSELFNTTLYETIPDRKTEINPTNTKRKNDDGRISVIT